MQYFPTGNPEIVLQFPVAANSRRYILRRHINPINANYFFSFSNFSRSAWLRRR